MTGVEASNITDIAFWIASALAIAAALLVVTLRDIFRAALFLALSFLAVAGIFVLLRAEFLAVVQVLIYVGAISILVIFAIMLVRDVPGGNTDNGMYAIAGTIAALLAAAVIFTAFNSDFTDIDALTATNADAEAALTGTYTEVAGQPGFELLRAAGRDDAGARTGVYANSTGAIGRLLIRDFVLPFEAVSLLLLAAMIGALALIRERSAP